MGALSPTHWLIIIGLAVLLFGARKLPDAARALGQSMRILKAETAELRDPDHDRAATGTATRDIGAAARPRCRPAAARTGLAARARRPTSRTELRGYPEPNGGRGGRRRRAGRGAIRVRGGRCGHDG